MIKFILIAGIWINPMMISTLKDRSGGCEATVIGGRAGFNTTSQTILSKGEFCEDLLKRISKK